MAQKYNIELVKQLQKKKVTQEHYGIEYQIKPIPDDPRSGVVDPRLYKMIRFPLFLMKWLPRQKKRSLTESLPALQKMFNAVKSKPITKTKIQIDALTIDCNKQAISIRIYRPANLVKTDRLPVLYYIHGGGFFAGSMNVVEETVKYFCEAYPCVAVSIDYRLAPENPYPASHEDCYEALQWIINHIDQYQGNANQIFLAGDSAGGNLALYCGLREKKMGLHHIKALALYYPTVNMVGKEDDYYKAGRQNYNVQEKYRPAVFGILDMLGENGLTGLGEVLSVEDTGIADLSPYWANLSGLPNTILLFGEYDFFYPECLGFAKKLHMANTRVKPIIYKGLTHGFLDSIGTFPQAEDSILEVIQFVKESIKEN